MEKMRLPKKPDSVVNALRDAILSGQIECGTELTQMELAENLGVSRMPIREALIVLEYQGLVERLSNQHVRPETLSCAEYWKLSRKATFTMECTVPDTTDQPRCPCSAAPVQEMRRITPLRNTSAD